MTAWIAFTAIVAVVSLLGWVFWGDIGRWHTHEPPECTGCGKGLMKPGCPVHDEELRKAA